jgi:hypothetical protein
MMFASTSVASCNANADPHTNARTCAEGQVSVAVDLFSLAREEAIRIKYSGMFPQLLVAMQQ